MIFGVLKLRKFDINSLDICPPHLYSVATVPWEIQKVNFSIVLFIHTSEYLRYLRRKQTVTALPTHLKLPPHYLVKCTNFASFSFFFHAYRVPIRNTDELWKRLVATWAEFQQNVVDDAVDQWWKRLEACIHAEGGHFEYLLWRCLPDIPFATHHNRFFSEPSYGNLQRDACTNIHVYKLPKNLWAKHAAMQLLCWQDNGLAIHRSRVRVLAGQHCVVALGKLLTPVCLCHQAV